MKISECLDCGKQSVPFFGMFGPCELNGGSHRRMVQVEQLDSEVSARLRAAWEVVPDFDRVAFLRKASAAERALIGF